MKTISVRGNKRSNSAFSTTALVGALAWAGLAPPAYARTDPELPPLVLAEAERQLVESGQLPPVVHKAPRVVASKAVAEARETLESRPPTSAEIAPTLPPTSTDPATATVSEQKPAEGLALAAAALMATAPSASTVQPSATSTTEKLAEIEPIPSTVEQKPVDVATLVSAEATAAARSPNGKEVNAQPTPASALQLALVVAPPALTDAIKSTLVQPALAKLSRDKKLLQGLTAFYASNGPVWVDSNGLTSSALHVLDRIAHAEVDGLNPADFNAVIAAARPTADGRVGTADDLAKIEVATSLAVLNFAQEAANGTIVPISINKLITRRPEALDPLAALKTVVAAPDRAAALEGFNPPAPGFAKLKQVLADLRKAGLGAEPPAPPMVEDGPALKPGMIDPRVAQLRTRLGVEAKKGEDPNLFDDAVTAAVKEFEKSAGLKPDGIVAKRVVAALNVVKKPAKLTEREVLANLEMWRWMPRNFGRDYVLVNVPDFNADVVRDGQLIHSTKVVVGKPTTQTPLFSGVMQFLIVNPSWNVPESIRVKEFLPEIRRDPQAFFYNHGYQAVRDGQVVDPATVDWDTEITKVGIRQPPGDDNALGHIKFMFPNQHAVYLHDTSSRSFFAHEMRALSHGCVRVDKPLDFAAAVLRDDPTWTAEQVAALYGGAEQRIDLVNRLNVHIGYFTVWVDDKGMVQHRHDVYGYANQVATALEKTKS